MLKLLFIISRLTHGQITVTTEILELLMGIESITIIARGQMIATEEALIRVPMKIKVKTVANHLIMITGETWSETKILMVM